MASLTRRLYPDVRGRERPGDNGNAHRWPTKPGGRHRVTSVLKENLRYVDVLDVRLSRHVRLSDADPPAPGTELSAVVPLSSRCWTVITVFEKHDSTPPITTGPTRIHRTSSTGHRRRGGPARRRAWQECRRERRIQRRDCFECIPSGRLRPGFDARGARERLSPSQLTCPWKARVISRAQIAKAVTTPTTRLGRMRTTYRCATLCGTIYKTCATLARPIPTPYPDPRVVRWIADHL